MGRSRCARSPGAAVSLIDWLAIGYVFVYLAWMQLWNTTFCLARSAGAATLRSFLIGQTRTESAIPAMREDLPRLLREMLAKPLTSGTPAATPSRIRTNEERGQAAPVPRCIARLCAVQTDRTRGNACRDSPPARRAGRKPARKQLDCHTAMPDTSSRRTGNPR